jgi:hypothetical protein
MARQRKTLPARRQSAMNDSLLIRSAESIGRMIGALQKQVDAARQATSRVNGDASSNGKRRAAKSAAAKTRGSRRQSGAKQRSRRKSGS